MSKTIIGYNIIINTEDFKKFILETEFILFGWCLQKTDTN